MMRMSRLSDRIQAGLTADITLVLAAAERRNPMANPPLPEHAAKVLDRINRGHLTPMEREEIRAAVGLSGCFTARANTKTGVVYLMARPRNVTGIWQLTCWRCRRCKTMTVRERPNNGLVCVVCGACLTTFEEVYDKEEI